MGIEAMQIRELRDATGAGVMDCKRALEEARGDLAKARAILSEKAEKSAQKKADKEVRAGVVEAYIHGEGRIGVLVEVHCETDFLARTAEFRSLVKDIALQIASEAPQYVSAKDVPDEVIQEVERQAEVVAMALGKPDRVVSQIRAGKVRKFLSQRCLLEQRFIKDQEITVGALVHNLSAKSRENVRVARFTRYQTGG